VDKYLCNFGTPVDSYKKLIQLFSRGLPHTGTNLIERPYRIAKWYMRYVFGARTVVEM